MSVDRLTLEAYAKAVEPRIQGTRIEKVRPHGPSALKLDLSSRDILFLDVSRGLSGFFLLSRANRLPRDARDVAGPSRTSALLFKKHLEGARILGLSAGPTRIQALATSRARVLLRPYGPPGATLFLSASTEAATAFFGASERVSEEIAAPPLVYPSDRARALVGEVAGLSGADKRARLSAVDPGLLPLLKGWPVSGSAQTRLAELLSGDRPPEARLTPVPGDDAANREHRILLLPFEPDGDSVPGSDFVAAAARWYELNRRAELFADRIQSRISLAKTKAARLNRLKSALDRDRGRWPDPAIVRLQAEALLAAPPVDEAPRANPALSPEGVDSLVVPVPDPRTDAVLAVRINPRLSWPRNANLFYERARNIEKRRSAFEERWSATCADLDRAEAELLAAQSVRSLDDLEPSESESDPERAARSRYLTSRGLEIVFGRSAAENHEVTFKVARREDLWFHVLDAPGGHVVLRNRDGRANQEDIAEAASVAAFLSERRTESRVDVQYTERKHVHPAGGGRGRVRVVHAEVIRVAPRDPAGRLRAR